ncbi:MAG: hypothetical protein Harvfovirus38_10 [Harvfovirus sp.]|uniref:Uncharacterized protein n=1 Tax=Harvfovirus sp. TaxID=2487768 RepID=A0A3G5A2R5_9VIRU|nr:MAG: hypothetical protein Harvfovirus38_10 [Harvfovirus sp.]
MVIAKPSMVDIQIDIPVVLREMIHAYTNWELQPREEVMTWLLAM